MSLVLVLSRYPSVRAGLRAMLHEMQDLDARESFLEGTNVDLVLLDYDEESFDGYLQNPVFKHIPIVVLGGEADVANCLTTLEVPAWGLVPRDASVEELQATISAVRQGLVVLPPQALAAIGNPLRKQDVQPLTERERQVLQLIAEGLANKEIANRLGISIHTAKFHVAAILEKLNASSRAEAVSIGIRGGAVHL